MDEDTVFDDDSSCDMLTENVALTLNEVECVALYSWLLVTLEERLTEMLRLKEGVLLRI